MPKANQYCRTLTLSQYCRMPLQMRSIWIGMQVVMCVTLSKPIKFEPHALVGDSGVSFILLSYLTLRKKTSHLCEHCMLNSIC